MKFNVRYEFNDVIEADSRKEAEEMADAFCDDEDNKPIGGQLEVDSITEFTKEEYDNDKE